MLLRMMVMLSGHGCESKTRVKGWKEVFIYHQVITTAKTKASVTTGRSLEHKVRKQKEKKKKREIKRKHRVR